MPNLIELNDAKKLIICINLSKKNDNIKIILYFPIINKKLVIKHNGNNINVSNGITIIFEIIFIDGI